MRRPVIGELLLQPVALIAVAVLLVNDHFVKAHYPGVVTGKVSDFAGLIYFPLLIVTLIDAGSRVVRHKVALSRRILVFSVAATGIVFAAVKTTHVGAQASREIWGLLHWPFYAVAAGHWVPISPGHLAQDPTDLIALPMLAVSYFVGCRGLRLSQSGSMAI